MIRPGTPRGLPPILPTPKIARPGHGAFLLRDGIPIVLVAGSVDSDLAAAHALRRTVREACGVLLGIETHARCDDLGPRVELRRTGEAGDAHHLVVGPSRIEVVGDGPAGLRYAVETLAQLVSPRGRVPACRIEDAPDLALRGIMLDVSRGKVPRSGTLRALIDLCVRLKLNVLMLYTEHTFRFRRHPEIGAKADPLDAATMRELEAYAAERHVDLVPTLQTLGHMHHILGLPRYEHLAETERRWTISPAEPGTYTLLGEMLDEYLPNFRSRFFNANCDEPWDLAQGKSAQREAQLGRGGVYLEHVRRVRDLARTHGKRTMIWGDVVHAHPDRIAEIDRDLVLLDWWYEADHDFDRVRTFAAHGIDFLVCPGTSSWNCLFPRIENSIANVEGYAAAGKRHGALGLIDTDWGDFGHYNLQGYSYFGYAWGAQQAWAGRVEPDDFDRATARLLFGDASGRTAHLYRELGALHDAGFECFNASPLQHLYFDDIGPAFWSARAKRRALKRTHSRLVRVRGRIAASRHSFARETLAWDELMLAADTSRLACRKGLAALEFLAWRRRPATWNAARRRSLAATLERVAAEQRDLGRRLRRLWLARSRPSNFEITKRRLDASIRSLRAAARSLRRNRPPAAPEIRARRVS